MDVLHDGNDRSNNMIDYGESIYYTYHILVIANIGLLCIACIYIVKMVI